MATTELTIRQLADEGGTTPIAPVTVTDAVLKGDGTTLTEELTALNNGLPYLQEVTGTTSSAGILILDTPFAKVVSASVASVGNSWYVLTRKAGAGNAACFIFDNTFTAVVNTSVTLAVWRIL